MNKSQKLKYADTAKEKFANSEWNDGLSAILN